MNYKQEIVSSIQKISGKYSPYQIFRDWCEMLAITIQNSCCLFHDDLWKQREDLYTSIFSKYEDSEKEYIFVVDVSGSMSGSNKMQKTKRT